MLYYSALAQVLALVLIVFILIESIKFINHMILVKKLKTLPFPKQYKKIVKKIPYYNLLSEDLKFKIKYKMMLFIEEKEWLGIENDVTNEMKVVISFYACLLIVNLENESYENLNTIYIYPYEYIIDEVKNHHGVYTKEKFIIEGQSAGGVVLISWYYAKKDAYNFKNSNVIIHEFAHELDFEDGVANGVPILEKSNYKSWADTMFKTYKEVNEKSITNRFWGKYKLFGYNASINEAEFFAVATELFFENPKSLHKIFPSVYNQLKQFYKHDTIKLFYGK